MALNHVNATETEQGSNTAPAAVEKHVSELVNSVDQALAILDPENDQVIWSSAFWDGLFPHWKSGVSWSSALSASPQMHDLYQAFVKQHSDSGVLFCESAGDRREMRFRTLADGLIGLHAVPQRQVLDDMHMYMQARESMFTTSRTISISEMATTLAHEIKQPIASISNILKALKMRIKREDLTNEQLEQSLNSALEQTQFTNSVINRIRDFTQARRPSQQRLDLAVITRESLSLMDWLLSANQCSVELIVTSEPLYCQGDPTMLQQVLVNLLRNGVEAMQGCDPANRRLVVTCQQRDSAIRVSIQDNGHGLEGKEHSLFLAFSTTKSNGMGVGLNICRSFIELHQGRLWLSPNDDIGCTSHIQLPQVDELEKATDDSNLTNTEVL